MTLVLQALKLRILHVTVTTLFHDLASGYLKKKSNSTDLGYTLNMSIEFRSGTELIGFDFFQRISFKLYETSRNFTHSSSHCCARPHAFRIAQHNTAVVTCVSPRSVYCSKSLYKSFILRELILFLKIFTPLQHSTYLRPS